jgi:nucleotide-binding universal stress UspA family protein
MATSMPGAVVVCVDGSELAAQAARAGLAILQPTKRVVVATVVEGSDPFLVSGGGVAGGVMSAEEFDELESALAYEGRQVAERAAAAIGVTDAEMAVVRGEPGPALCRLATELPARALVMGSRGRSGIKRAVLGSVSDYVVRHAPCPVVITRPGD